MFRITLSRYSQIATTSSRSFPASVKSSYGKRKQHDQFGLLSYGMAPQIEKFEEKQLHGDRWFKREKVVKQERRNFDFDKKSQPRLKVITIPATLSKKKLQKLEKQLSLISQRKGSKALNSDNESNEERKSIKFADRSHGI